MSILWHPIEIEQALSAGYRHREPLRQEALEREARARRPERVLLEWVEPVPLGAAVAYFLTMDWGGDGDGSVGRDDERGEGRGEEVTAGKSEEIDGT